MWAKATIILLSPKQNKNDDFYNWYVDQSGSIEMGLRVEPLRGLAEQMSRAATFQKTWKDLLLRAQAEIEFFDALPLVVSGDQRQPQSHCHDAAIKHFSESEPPADVDILLSDDDPGKASPSSAPATTPQASQGSRPMVSEEKLTECGGGNLSTRYTSEPTAAPRFRRFATIRDVRALSCSDDGSGNGVTDGTVEATIVVRLDVAMDPSLVGAPLNIRLALTAPLGWAAGEIPPYPVPLHAHAYVSQLSAPPHGNASSNSIGDPGESVQDMRRVRQLRPCMSVLDESIALLDICDDSGDDVCGGGYQPTPAQTRAPSDATAAAIIVDREGASAAALEAAAVTTTTTTTQVVGEQLLHHHHRHHQLKGSYSSGSAVRGTNDGKLCWARPPEARRQEIFHTAVWLLRSSPEEERAAVAAMSSPGSSGDCRSFSFLAVHQNGLPVAAAPVAGYGDSKCLAPMIVDTAYYAATRSELKRFWKRRQKLNSHSDNYDAAATAAVNAAVTRSTNRRGDGSLNRSRIDGSLRTDNGGLTLGREHNSTSNIEAEGAGATRFGLADRSVDAGVLVPVFVDIDSLALQKLPEKLKALLKLCDDDGSCTGYQIRLFEMPSSSSSSPLLSAATTSPRHYCHSSPRESASLLSLSWLNSSYSSSFLSSFPPPPLTPRALSVTSSSSAEVGQDSTLRQRVGYSLTKHRILVVEPVVLEVSPPALVPFCPRRATAIAFVGIEERRRAVWGLCSVVNVFVKNIHPTRTVLLRSLDFHLDRTLVPKLNAMLSLRVGGQQPHDDADSAPQEDLQKGGGDEEPIADIGGDGGGVDYSALSSFLVGTSRVAKSDWSSVAEDSSNISGSSSSGGGGGGGGGLTGQSDEIDDQDRLLLERLFDKIDISDVVHCRWLQDECGGSVGGSEELQNELETKCMHKFAGTSIPRLLQPLSLSPGDALGCILALEMSGVDALPPAHMRRLQHLTQCQQQHGARSETHTHYDGANSETIQIIGSAWRSGSDKPLRRASHGVAVPGAGPPPCPLPSSPGRVLLRYNEGAWRWAGEQIPIGAVGGGPALALTTPLTVSYTLGQIRSTCGLSGFGCSGDGCGSGTKTTAGNGHGEGVKMTTSSAVNEADTKARNDVGTSKAMRHAVLSMEWCLPYRSGTLGPTSHCRTWLEKGATTNHEFTRASVHVSPSSSSSSSFISSDVSRGFGRELLVQLSLCGGGGGGSGSKRGTKGHKATSARTMGRKAVGKVNETRNEEGSEKGWHLWAGGDLWRSSAAASAATTVGDYSPSAPGAPRYVVEGEVFWVCIRVADLGRTDDPSPPAPLDLVVLADHSYRNVGMEASDSLAVARSARGGGYKVETLAQPSPSLLWHSIEDDREANALFPNAARKKANEDDENDEVELGPFNCCEGDAALAEWHRQTRNDSPATEGGGGGGGDSSADRTLRVNPVAITSGEGICVVAIDREKRLPKTFAGPLSGCGYALTGAAAAGVWTGSLLLRYMPINCRGLVRLGRISFFERASREYFNVGTTLQVVVVDRKENSP